MNRTFKCARCGGVFDSQWSDEEMLAEKEANGFWDMPPEEGEMVCDVCYNKIMNFNTPQNS